MLHRLTLRNHCPVLWKRNRKLNVNVGAVRHLHWYMPAILIGLYSTIESMTIQQDTIFLLRYHFMSNYIYFLAYYWPIKCDKHMPVG